MPRTNLTYFLDKRKVRKTDIYVVGVLLHIVKTAFASQPANPHSPRLPPLVFVV